MGGHTYFDTRRKPAVTRWGAAVALIVAVLVSVAMLASPQVRLSQASAAELTENIITSAEVTKKELTPRSYTTQLKMGFKLPSGIHAGDTSTIKLANTDFKYYLKLDFNVMSSDGSVAAKAHVDPDTGTLTLTYTDYVEKHSDITGKIDVSVKIDTDKVKDYGKKSVDLDVDGHRVPAGEINYGPWKGDNPDEVIAKWSSGNYAHNYITYTLRVNAKGEDMKNVTVSDVLRTYGLTYDKSSFEVLRGSWTVNPASKAFEFHQQADVSSSTTVNFTNEGKGGFNIKLGNIGTDGYLIRYKVNINHTPLNREAFKNSAKVNYNGNTKGVDWTAVWETGGGEANGYNYSIKIRKTDENGAPLKCAVFEVKRDSSGEVVGTVTTDSSGAVTLGGLLADSYTLTEVTAPEGYEKAAPVKITAGNLENGAKTAEVKIVDKKIPPVVPPTPPNPPAPPVVPPTVPPATPPAVPPAPKPHKQLARTGAGLWSVVAAGSALFLAGAVLMLRRRALRKE